MANGEIFDVTVIGSGPGGYVAAIVGARTGAAVGALAGPAGASAGVVLGDVLDERVLDNHRCLECGYSFSANSDSRDDTL